MNNVGGFLPGSTGGDDLPEMGKKWVRSQKKVPVNYHQAKLHGGPVENSRDLVDKVHGRSQILIGTHRETEHKDSNRRKTSLRGSTALSAGNQETAKQVSEIAQSSAIGSKNLEKQKAPGLKESAADKKAAKLLAARPPYTV